MEKDSTERHFMEEIRKSLEVLRKGGVILYPTDTIWGLGCDATNLAAVDKIISLKKREKKSFVVLLDSMQKLGKYILRVPDVAWDLVAYSDKPLTVVYPGAVNVAPGVAAPDGTLAVRITRHPFCKRLIERLGRPLVSTSANLSGRPYPASFNDIEPVLKSQVDYMVNLPAEKSRKGRPSSILSLGVNGEVRIIRK